MSDSFTHNLDQIKPQLSGFGQHVSQLPTSDRLARIAQLKKVILDAGRELDQLMAEPEG